VLSHGPAAPGFRRTRRAEETSPTADENAK
jgi:hypothetical protein